MRESFFQSSTFKNYFEYKIFTASTLYSPRSISNKLSNSSEKFGDLADIQRKGLINQKVLFVCCDGSQKNSRKVLATFLDVWRDTSFDAGLTS